MRTWRHKISTSRLLTIFLYIIGTSIEYSFLYLFFNIVWRHKKDGHNGFQNIMLIERSNYTDVILECGYRDQWLFPRYLYNKTVTFTFQNHPGNHISSRGWKTMNGPTARSKWLQCHKQHCHTLRVSIKETNISIF